MKVTKTQLTAIFEGGKSWEEVAADFTTQSGVEVSVKMVHELFKANGFNLRKRVRKNPMSWITVIDDTTPVSDFPVESFEDEEVLENNPVETEELA